MHASYQADQHREADESVTHAAAVVTHVRWFGYRQTERAQKLTSPVLLSLSVTINMLHRSRVSSSDLLTLLVLDHLSNIMLDLSPLKPDGNCHPHP